MEGLERLPEVKEVALFGKGLHAVTADAAAATPAVRAYLEGQGHAVRQIERATPSLEDVFVSLIEARDRAEQPQAEVRR